jgi:predicted branched-subunit amino acid permease
MDPDPRTDSGAQPGPTAASRACGRSIMTTHVTDERASEAAATAAELYWLGVRRMAPLLLGLFPFALVVGDAVAHAGNVAAAWAGTLLVYSASAQLAALATLAKGSGWEAAACIGILVNVRLSAYATAMQPEWSGAGRARKVLAGLLIADPPWALARAHGDGRRAFYLGAASLTAVAWPIFTTLGMVMSGALRQLPVLTLMPAIALAALVVPHLRARPAALSLIAAMVAAIATVGLPAGQALGLTGLVGGAAGVCLRPGR